MKRKKNRKYITNKLQIIIDIILIVAKIIIAITFILFHRQFVK